MNSDAEPRLDGKLATMITVAVLALVAVVVGAFVLSYDALTAVAEAAHVAVGLSWLMSVSVDGAMTVGTMAALVLKMLGKKTGYAWFVVLAGVVISVACNALHATQSEGGTVHLDGWQAGAVSAIPAVALALSLHLLIILIEAITDALSARRSAVEADEKPRTEVAVEPVREPVRTALPAPVRTPEPPRTATPYAARTEPVRTDGSSLVQTPRTEPDKARTDARTDDEALPETPRTAAHNTSSSAPTLAVSDVKPPKTLVKPPPGPVDRDELVAELTSEIEALGDEWKPNYEVLMLRTGFGRSWCEKVVKDARTAARLDTPPASRTDAPYGLRTEGESARTAAPYGTRTEEVDEPRTDDGEMPRTEPVRTPLRLAN